MNVTRQIIEHCVDVELEAARREHEGFHSLHEAYAVTLEKVEEAKVELESIKDMMMDVWRFIKNDGALSANVMFGEVERAAVCLAADTMQMAVMARKARRLGKGENKTWFGKE